VEHKSTNVFSDNPKNEQPNKNLDNKEEEPKPKSIKELKSIF
jgi:hypothetical protein